MGTAQSVGFRSKCALHREMASFFFNDTATTEIYTLSLHDALPICFLQSVGATHPIIQAPMGGANATPPDRKSTRLNSSHVKISYAVFCLKKKKKCDLKVPRSFSALGLLKASTMAMILTLPAVEPVE